MVLSDRKIAQVIDTNPDNPKAPIVQYLTEKNPDGSPKVVATGVNGLSIMRILSKAEEKDILNLVEDKYKAIEEAQQEAAAAPVENTSTAAAGTVSTQPADMSKTEEVDINMFS